MADGAYDSGSDLVDYLQAQLDEAPSEAPADDDTSSDDSPADEADPRPAVSRVLARHALLAAVTFGTPAEADAAFELAEPPTGIVLKKRTRAKTHKIKPTTADRVTTFPSKAEAIDAYIGRRCIIIQATHAGECKFNVYETAAALDAATDHLLAGLYVREVVVRDYQRLAFVDIDSKVTPVITLTTMFNQVFGVKGTTRVYPTYKGYHLIAENLPSNFVGLTAMRTGLKALADALPNACVDVGAVTTLRLAGTRDKKGRGRKWIPPGTKLSQNLVQPLCAPEDDAPDTEEPQGVYGDDIKAGIAALTDDADSLGLHSSTGAAHLLSRSAPSACKACDGKVHDSQGARLIISPGERTGIAYCLRAMSTKSGIPFALPSMAGYDPTNKFPGVFEERKISNEYYLEGGVRPSPEGDYIESSSCGLGKSKAAWKSISETEGPAPSVLCVSYRHTLSKSQGKLNGCDLYSDGRGPIAMWAGRRVMCQLESLHRIKGIPDVLLIDELHGMFRQASSAGGVLKSKAWAMLETLIKGAGRVIVLDAEAHDEDARLLGDIRGCQFAVERNTFKPHTNKTIYAYPSYEKDMLPALEEFLRSRRARFPRGPDGATPPERMRTKFVIITQAKSHVIKFSELLEKHDVKHQAYHGKTDPELKALHFADPNAHWADLEAVVYNSTLEAGVSIEGPEWTTAWCRFTGIGAVESAMQSLHRFRAITAYHTSARRSNLSGADYNPTTREGIANHIKLGGRFLGENEDGQSTKSDDSLLKFVKDYVLLGGNATAIPFTRMWFTTQLELNRSARYWPTRFYTLLTNTGFKIEEGGPILTKTDVPAECKKNTADCTVFHESYEKQVAMAPVAPYLELKAKNEGAAHVQIKTMAQQLGRDKHILMEEYGVEEEMTEEFVNDFGNRKALQAHRSIVRLKRHKRATYTDAVAMEYEAERWRNGGGAPKTSTDAHRHTLLAAALVAFGFDQLDSKSEVSVDELRATLDANNPPEALIELHAIRYLWKNHGVAPLRKAPTTFKSHLGAINAILRAQYGATLVSTQGEGKCSHLMLKQTKWPDGLLAGEWTDPLPDDMKFVRQVEPLSEQMQADLFELLAAA
jgi:hypothetical protein